MDLSTQQGYAHLETIVRHLTYQTPLSKFFIQMSESFQIQSGLFGSCWENLFIVPYVQSPWIQSTRRFFSFHMLIWL
jgi:hypothetical protein